jgi:hypothetical protein
MLMMRKRNGRQETIQRQRATNPTDREGSPLLRVSDWYEGLVIPSLEVLHVVVDTVGCVPQLLLYITGSGVIG